MSPTQEFSIDSADLALADGTIVTEVSAGSIQYRLGKYRVRQCNQIWGVFRLDIEGEYKVASAVSRAAALAYLVSLEDPYRLNSRSAVRQACPTP